MFHESKITIDGKVLTNAQAMTLRVAMCSWVSELSGRSLGEDSHGKFMQQSYLRTGKEVRDMLIEGAS